MYVPCCLRNLKTNYQNLKFSVTSAFRYWYFSISVDPKMVFTSNYDGWRSTDKVSHYFASYEKYLGEGRVTTVTWLTLKQQFCITIGEAIPSPSLKIFALIRTAACFHVSIHTNLSPTRLTKNHLYSDDRPVKKKKKVFNDQ